MSVLTESKLRSRWKELSESKDSITINSTWLLHHAKATDVETICDTWLKEISSEKDPRRIVTLIYLANDVIQNSRKKLPELGQGFFPRLENEFRAIRKRNDESISKSARRCLEVWADRQIFNKEQVHALEHSLGVKRHAPSTTPSLPSSSFFMPDSPEKTARILDLTQEKKEQLERATKEMVNVLSKLDNAPSFDKEIRDRIAAIPESTANPSYLQRVKREEEAKEILENTKKHGPLCKDYCDALANEVLDRRALHNHVSEMLETVKMIALRNTHITDELKKKETAMKKELKKMEEAYESLPDLAEMEKDLDSSQLPSVRDLFS